MGPSQGLRGRCPLLSPAAFSPSTTLLGQSPGYGRASDDACNRSIFEINFLPSTNLKIIPYFCNMEFKDFILAHEGEDLGALALARGRYAGEVEDFDLALTTLEVRRKLRTKVPSWYAEAGLRYPLRLSGEQCSSEETARYKAQVAAACCDGHPFAIADLTGGLGVDSWTFAQVADQVLYNEMRLELADAARANFAALGISNIQVVSYELSSGNVASVLGGFRPDVLFLDPARRASDGRKVFRLEDCQPDVLQLLPELFAVCPLVLLKLSPMADITLVCKQLGGVQEVHVVAAEGECKELLLLLERGYEGSYGITVYENGSVLALDQVQCMFGPGPIPGAGPGPASMASTGLEGIVGGPGPGVIIGPSPKVGWTRSKDVIGKVMMGKVICSEDNLESCFGKILFEPGKALLKAGAFDLPCDYGLEKLGRHTHLYVGSEVPEALLPFGKVFRLVEAMPMDKRSLKNIGLRYPKASVTARNIPLTSDALRKKLGVADGGSVHIFGAHVDTLSAHYLLICTPA